MFSSYRVNAVSTVTYVALGWLPAIPLIPHTPTECLIWMVAGGLSYTVGIVFLIGSLWFTYAHAVWHLMVMLGSACHCYAIYILLFRH
ncbi:MAG: hemolysin III family protein [Pirellulaceae bacterium]